jgi:spermidine/putrescine transport system permease protein
MKEPLERPISLGLRLVSWGLFLFLYIPIIVVVIYSFNEAKFGVEWTGFSLKWYQKLFENEVVANATINTIVLAVISTAIATVLGTMLGYGLYKYRFPGAGIVQWLMYIPVVTPDIVMAISLLLTYAFLRQFLAIFEPGMFTMVVAHVTFQIAFVAIIVRSRLSLLDPALEEAARDLYAGPIATIRHVILPLALPGIISGALLAFTLSVDDFVISFFTAGPTSQTLPIYIYSSVKRGVTPEINALSTLIILITIIAIFASNSLSARSDKK